MPVRVTIRITLDYPIIGMTRTGTLICKDSRSGEVFDTGRNASSIGRKLTALEQHCVSA